MKQANKLKPAKLFGLSDEMIICYRILIYSSDIPHGGSLTEFFRIKKSKCNTGMNFYSTR